MCDVIQFPVGSERVRFERLLRRYEDAAYDVLCGRRAADDLNELSCRVEDEANRIGYTDHARLMALHTLAEQVCTPAAERDPRFRWLNG